MLPVIKAHAYGNDFLYVEASGVRDRRLPTLARAICARHTGIGADGLIVYQRTAHGASMKLFNADGSDAEVSGNGVRGLGSVLLVVHGAEPPGGEFVVETDAGEKRLALLSREGSLATFRAAMGHPTGLAEATLDVLGEPLRVVTLRVGNPQCVRLEDSLDEDRMRRLGAALEHHPAFPEGTNVEFAHVGSPSQVDILIWERGVGPTSASGTGACASAVAAAAFGGSSRDVRVVSPGGAQRVEWREDGLFLTGSAGVVLVGEWIG
jgi:diaminopimelate epimerase